MKKHYPFSTSFLIATALLLILFGSGCSSTGTLSFWRNTPPALTLPEDIQRVAVVNRTLQEDTKGGKAINVIEGILSGEGLREDNNGSWSCLAGAANQLNLNGYVKATYVDSIALRGTGGSGIMAIPLDWKKAREICQATKTDALLVLEVFDTDQTNQRTENIVNQVGSVITTGKPTPTYVSSPSKVLIKMAWRLYDPFQEVIIDEWRNDQYVTVSGVNVSGIPDVFGFAKKDAIGQTAFWAGQGYGTRLLPGRVRIRRSMYSGGSRELKIAWRMVEVNDWDRAIPAYETIAKNGKPKHAGRASLNLAVSKEFKGKIDEAIKWAQDAYTIYGENRFSKNYVRTLKRL